MFNSLVESFFGLLRRPSLLVPGFFLTLTQAVLMWLFFYFNDTIARFYYELFVLNLFPEINIFSSIFLLAIANPLQMLFLAVFVAFWFFASFWMIFSFTKVVFEKEPPIKSFFEALNKVGKIFGLSIFAVMLLVLYSLVLLAILWVGFLFDALVLFSAIGAILWLLFGFFLLLKLFFLPVEFFSGDKKITGSIKHVWAWSAKHFFSIFVFLIIVSVVCELVLGLGVIVADLFPPELEVASILAIILAFSFSLSFFGYSVVNYYFSHN